MLREWPFTARFAAWRSRWANGKPRGLLELATEAFIDRTPIDWITLHSRARTDSERAIIQGLCRLDVLRDGACGEVRTRDHSSDLLAGIDGARPPQGRLPPISALAGLLIVFAASQVLCSITVVTLTFATGQRLWNRIPQMVLALGFAAVSVFLGTAASRDPRGLYLLGFFTSMASAFARALFTDVPDEHTSMVGLLLRGVLPEAFAPAWLWQFAVTFPYVRRFTAFDMWARRATAAVWCFGMLLFGVNLVAAHVAIDTPPFAYLLRSGTNRIFSHLLTLALLPSVVTILVRTRRAPLSERRRVVRLAFVIATGTAPLLLLCIARVAWSGIDAWLLISGVYHICLALIVAALAATPILTTAVIIVDRPVELQSVLRRASRYALARSVLTMLVVAPFIVLFVVLYGQRHVAIADLFAGPQGWLLLSCSAVGCLLLLARSRLLQTVDRRLSRRAADHPELLARSLERVRLARGSREIIATVARELHESIGAEPVHLLVPTGTDAFVDPFADTRRLSRNGAIVALLEQSDMPVDLSSEGPLLSLLLKEDRDWIAANDVKLAAAVTQRDGTLAAVALVGAKRTGLPFDGRDEWFISSLLTAAAAAWNSDQLAKRPGEVMGRAGDRDEAALECPRCGVVAESGPLPCACGVDAVLASLPRRVREKFVVQRRLGAGGMGVVYLGRDTTLDRDVALKTLPGLDKHSVAGLRNEALAMAALSHEALAVIYDLEIWRDTPVLVVEYLPNGTLAHRLISARLGPADTLQLGLALTRALTYVHARGVLHRDLKPSNIGFAATGMPKLLDFGLATLMPPSNNVDRRSGANRPRGARPPLAGTPAYLPPEAYEGAPATAAFDLWALSLVMLEAMSGVNPFAAADQIRPSPRGGNGAPVDLDPYLRDLTPAVRRFFDRALARRPDRRFQTGLDLHAALEDAARSA